MDKNQFYWFPLPKDAMYEIGKCGLCSFRDVAGKY